MLCSAKIVPILKKSCISCLKIIVVLRRVQGVLWSPAERTHSGFHRPQAPSNQPTFRRRNETVPAV
jgi:hypothetical protein